MKRADIADREARLDEAYERAENGDDGGIDILLDELKTTSTEEEPLRVKAARLLSVFGEETGWIEPRAEAVLFAAAKAASTSDLAYTSLHLLQMHGGPTAIPALLEVISFPETWNAHADGWRDPDAPVDEAKRLIDWMMHYHRDEGLQCLLEQLRTSSGVAAARLLGEHGDQRARPVLEEIADDERADPPLRAEARKALVAILKTPIRALSEVAFSETAGADDRLAACRELLELFTKLGVAHGQARVLCELATLAPLDEVSGLFYDGGSLKERLDWGILQRLFERFRDADRRRALDVARAAVAQQTRQYGNYGLRLGEWLEHVASVAELPEARQGLQEALAIYRDEANHWREAGHRISSVEKLYQAKLRRLEEHVARVEQKLLSL